MAFKWSKNQLEAIRTIGSNVLVSAGAGSGKTAVLTERIFQIIKSGHSLSRFLVLTFTNAAAGEMKTRLRDKLLADSQTNNLATEIEAAHIETFDAFSLYLVKKYCSRLCISSDINIMEPSLLKIQKLKIIDQVFNEYYESRNPLFVEMINAFCLKSDQSLKSFLEQIINLSNLKINKSAFFRYLMEDCYDTNRINSYIDNYYLQEVENFRQLRKLGETLSDLDDANQICDILDQIINAKNYDEFAFLKEVLIFPKQRSKYPEEDKLLRNYIATSFKEWKAGNFGPRKEVLKAFTLYQPYGKLLVEMAQIVDKRFFAFKKENHSYDFPDIARMALEIIAIPEVCEGIKCSFDFIMVDEYQDTSDIQEEVIRALSRDNVYMVGDVKQSIYRFRNANCQIFQDKFVAYKKNQGGKEIDLNVSFRSRYQVINFINETFAKLMTSRYNIINYDDGHNFVFEPVIYSQDNNNDYLPVVYTYTKGKSEENVDQEIAIIADDIIAKINDGFTIYDKEEKITRPVGFGDFSIIIDRATDFDKYHRYFSIRGIPLNVIQDERIDDSLLGMVTKNLIILFSSIANNNLDDCFIHAYVSIARSFLMRLPDQEIFDIVASKLFVHTALFEKLEKVVRIFKNSSLYEIVRALYDEFDIYHQLMRLDRINNNIEMVDSFLSFAKSMDDLGFSLDDFATYFGELTQYGLEVKVPRKGHQKNAVTIITIHRSKGLEYPIVYLPGLFKTFNRDEVKESFIASPDYGIFFPSPNDIPYASFPHFLIKQKYVQDDFEEKIRLFYVAITRVREKLIFLYPRDENDTTFYDLKKANCFKNFLEYLALPDALGKEYVWKKASIPSNSRQKASKIVKIKQLSLPSKLVEKKAASKKEVQGAEQSALEFGNQLHHLLEVVDYEKKDLSFISDKRLGKCVSNVLKSSLFANVKNKDLRHEYEFYDDVNQVHGIIDCLILKPNEIIIVDFKLKNLDDEHYIVQLHTYRDYIKSISDKPIRMYLVAALTGEERQID